MGFLDFIFRKKTSKSDFVVQYEQFLIKKQSEFTPLDQLNFTILDTETTGLDIKKDYIVSFGAVKMKGYRLNLEQSWEVYLDAPLQNEASLKIHEILYPIEISPIKDFAADFLKYIGRDIIVGHHIGFDLGMLEKILKSFGLKQVLNPILDTQALAIRLEQGPHFDRRLMRKGEYALDTLCERYGIPLDDRHTAAGDAFLTAQLLMKLLKLAEKKGIKNLKDLMQVY
ncbi:3'-5' exonuclease [Belliella sp. DSM 111904]|uniref:3'-5' exonuclease n=1 Tax=Belliella filtrata TaxID=2923435 RepID=A0ABS9UVQ8_9BACT|nr:3'-5' exonuclease [Belliella filtrata]MCH7407845.1 3'-5' exonuclease [Belliella filtrata]